MVKRTALAFLFVILMSAISNRLQPHWVEAQVEKCPGASELRLEVGGYARVLQAASLQPMTGNPYENGGLEDLDNWEISDDDVVLVVEGPVCYDGTYVWRVQPPIDTFLTQGNAYPLSDGTNMWLWEVIDGQYLLVPAEPPQSDIPETTLGLARAPIVDAAMQLSYTPGGNSGETPACASYIGNFQTTVTHDNRGEIEACIPIFFPVTSQTVIRVFHNDILYLEQQAEDDLRYWIIPIEPEYSLGTWIVEFASETSTHRIAYQIVDFMRYNFGITNRCLDFYPTLILSGFEPYESVELVTFLEAEYYADRTEGLLLESKQYETEQVTVGEDGVLIAYYGRVFDQYRYIFTSFIFEILSAQAAAVDVVYPLSCEIPPTLQYAKQHPIVLHRLISGTLSGENPDPIYYAFEGDAGQSVTITLVALENAFDPALELYDANDTRIAENDNAEPSVFGELNAQITDFVLPEDGLYTFSVSRESAETGAYVLIVD